MQNCRIRCAFNWILQGLVAIILAQTLFFKFTGAEESRFIFSSLGLEPWGRLSTAVAELVAVVLILVPRTAALGALLSLVIITGALASHLLVLGVEVQGDSGLLFALAVIVFLCSAGILRNRWRELPGLNRVHDRQTAP